jgi:hypothetical protein
MMAAAVAGAHLPALMPLLVNASCYSVALIEQNRMTAEHASSHKIESTSKGRRTKGTG